MADRSVLVRLRADISDFQRKFAQAGATTSVFIKNLDSADSRMGNLVQTALALGPALVPISAAGVPALAGLASQATFAAAGLGVLLAAFNGVGDALKALHEARLKPTTENLEKLSTAMQALPKDGREFVRFIDREVLPSLDKLQDRAAEGALPGFADGLDQLMDRLPEVSRLVEDLAQAGGKLARKGGKSLAGEEFDEFFEFLETEAEPTLMKFGKTVGNVIDGLATTLVGLNPLANDFEDALLGWSRGFADIEPEDFQAFVDYVRDVGPQAWDTLTALGSGLVAIVKAAAPVGQVALPVIEALANVIETIAESPAGPALVGTAAGLSAISRSIALFNAANGSALLNTVQGVGKSAPVAATGLGRMNQTISAMKTGAPIVAGLALAYSDLDDQMGLSNTAMLATMGLIAGPWGAAIGGGIGLLLDWKAAGDQADAATAQFNASLQGLSLSELTTQLTELQNMQKAIDEDSPIQDVLAQRVGATQKQIEVTRELATEQQRAARYEGYAEAIDRQRELLNAASEAGLKTAASFSRLGNSVDDAKVSLNEWQADQEKAVRALANFNDNSLKAARNGLDKGLIASLREMGVQGALRMDQLANGTEAGIARANRSYRAMQREIERTERVTQRLAGLSPVEVQVDAKTERANATIAALEAKLNNIADEDVFINVRHRAIPGSGSPGFGPRDDNAWGDYKDAHSPEIAPGGAMRVWAEPETQGESYIPHANDSRRPRAKRILEHTADKFGGQVMWFAEGGTTGDTDRPKRPPKPLPVGLPAETAALIRQFGSLRKALAASEKAVDRETNRREYLQGKLDATSQAMSDLTDITTAGFMNDPFRNREGSSDIWAAGAKGGGVNPLASLDEDIAYGQRRIQLQQQLQSAGLGGTTAAEQAALAEALKGSNDDLAALLANGQVQSLEDKLIQRQSLVGVAGAGASEMAGLNDVFRAQQEELATQTNELREVKAELRALRAEEGAREQREAQRGKENADHAGAVVSGGLDARARVAARNRARKAAKPR